MFFTAAHKRISAAYVTSLQSRLVVSGRSKERHSNICPRKRAMVSMDIDILVVLMSVYFI